MKILAVPKSTDKKYSFELFELLRYYQNEITAFGENSEISNIKIFSILKKLKEPFNFKNDNIPLKLDKILNDEKFDFIWNMGLNRESLHLLAQRADSRGIRFLQTISNDALIFSENWTKTKQPFHVLDKLVKFYDSSIDVYLVQSKFIKNILEQNGINQEKIIYIPAFIDSLKYSPCFKSENYFLYQYHPENQYGFDFIIDTMKKIPQHKLIINIEKKDSYIKEIKKKNRLKNILFVENLSETEKQNLFKMTKFTLIFSDTSPQEILESYAMGKPVLAVNSGSNEEYMVNTYSGLLFNIDVNDLSEKINYMMQNQAFCIEAGKFARSLAQNCFNKQNHYTTFFKAIHKIPKKKQLAPFNSKYLHIS